MIGLSRSSLVAVGERGSSRARARPWTRAAVAGSAAHVFLELGAGVGMPGASVAGPVPAALIWAGGTRAVWRIASSGRWTPTARCASTTAWLTAVVAHYTGWPHRQPRRHRLRLPWLTECEGLRGTVMVPYNLVLLFSGAAAVVALLRENRSALAVLGWAPLVLIPAFGRFQHAEQRRLSRGAEERPAWWNRRLQSP